MHMSLAGTNLSNEQSEIERVIFATVMLRDVAAPEVYQVHGPDACAKAKGGFP
jgi:hypothetical protein